SLPRAVGPEGRGDSLVRDDPDECVALFRPPSLPGMEVMAADRSSRPWHMFHERYAFRLCRKAEAGLRYRGRDELVHDATVVVRGPAEPDYTTFVAKPAEFRLLFVEPTLLADAAPQLGLSARPHFLSASLGADKQVFGTLDPSLHRDRGGQRWPRAAGAFRR